MEEYEVRYKMVLNYLKELSNRNYITTEDIQLILKILGEENDK